jgi:hydroxybutyrate-dimer hydrolase
VPVNHASRAYYAKAQAHGHGAPNLRYVEVTNAQHFDSFIPTFAGYDTRYVPLHVYLTRALDAMYAHLTSGTPLPPSQVVHAVPRGGVPGAAPPLMAANVPPIQAAPPPTERITFRRSTLFVPD